MNDESFVLYKFRAIDKHLIESLVSQSLYFARPDALNDPFDCQIDLKAALKRAESSAGGGLLRGCPFRLSGFDRSRGDSRERQRPG